MREGILKLKQPGAQGNKELYFFMFSDLLVGCGRTKKEKLAISGGPEFEYVLSLFLSTVAYIDDRKTEKKGLISLHVEKAKGPSGAASVEDKEKEKEKEKEGGGAGSVNNSNSEAWVLECKNKPDRMPWLADFIKHTTECKRLRGETLRINKKNEF